MAMTEFAMVEELASLVKDNLFCKHLVLSTEEALVDFLQDDTRKEGVLELQPMSPYQRLLLHRLADIYGFAHESVGEGDDRHLVLERCPETAIPSILVSDILWQYDEYESPTPSHHILRRKEAPELKMTETSTSIVSFEEREAAYLAARERIFSLHEDEEKEVIAPKSRNIPVVARRMIAHALGQKISANTSNRKILEKCERNGTAETNEKSEEPITSTSEATKETTTELGSCGKKAYDKLASKRSSRSSDASERKVHNRATRNSSSKDNLLPNGSNRGVVGIENLERLQIGAAKRMFAHALGRPSDKGDHSFPAKSDDGLRGSS